jgi:arylamine N-acetyltransferase
VRLPDEAIVIPREKLTHYLLVARVEDDKSKYLAQAGFTAERGDELEAGIRELVRQYDAEQDTCNVYGVFSQRDWQPGWTHRTSVAGRHDLDCADEYARQLPICNAEAGKGIIA